MKRLRVIVCALCTTVSGPAYSEFLGERRFVSFGDSMSDTGNLFALSGRPPVPYWQGRSSNGPVWVEHLAGPLRAATGQPGSGSINYAYGGARALGARPIDLPAQVAQFLGREKTFGPGDIVTLLAGANDAFGGLRASALGPGHADGVARKAGETVGQTAATLAGAGARTVVVANLPDLGGLPLYAGSPERALATRATQSFNEALHQAVMRAAASHPETNFVEVDTYGLVKAISADPSAFGISEVTAPCLETPSCQGSAQNGFLYYDLVHPTAAGHALLAAAVRQYLEAPNLARHAALLGETALMQRSADVELAFDRLRRAGIGTGEGDLVVTLRGANAHWSGPSNLRSTWATDGLSAGIVRAWPRGWSGAVMATVSKGEARSGPAHVRPATLGFDVLTGFRSSPLFVNAGAGLSFHRFDEWERATGVGPLTNRGATRGMTGSLSGEVGADLGFGPVTMTPLVRLSWLRATVDGFAEHGILAPIAYRSQTASALTTTPELKASAEVLRAGAGSLSVYGLVGYGIDVLSKDRTVRGRLVRNTARPFSTRVAAPPDEGLILGAGLAGRIGRFDVGVDYRSAFGTRSHHLSANLGLRL